MRMRDTRASEEYFEKYRKNQEYGVSRSLAVVNGLVDVEREPRKALDKIRGYASSHLGLVKYAYSMGFPVSDIRELVPAAIRALVIEKATNVRILPAETIKIRHNFSTQRDNYIDALEILSLAVIFDLPTGEISEATSDAGGDTLFELIASGQTSLAADAPVHLAWPRPYGRLLAVFQAEESKRPKLMLAFLKVWHQQNKGVTWWKSHEIVDVGGLFYGGYWCFEAAAVVKLLGIDDSSFRDNEFYPADLVHPDEE
ncbi:PoNe immunity protein domain-containing protein [Agreia pratensis]|uniref:PoNi C-terminal domain-containing protein n=1 Tax=Agreia pratensis TaxID=150121 RepID=A0A1X7JMA7_9MICO|nr:PoNe immunity protein domain-containing protein [Agreia pratensis]SMG29053.1 protein of unknown function [Agreia pratensis]